MKKSFVIIYVLLMCCASSYCDTADSFIEAVRVPFSKILINDDIAKHNKFIPASLAGKEVSVLGIRNNRTVVTDSNNAVYELEGDLNGQYSLAEKYYAASGKINISTFGIVNYEAQSFSASELPEFSSFSGKITTGRESRLLGYQSEKDIVDVACCENWGKYYVAGSSAPGMARFDIQIEVTNMANHQIKDLEYNFYIEDRNGGKYYPNPASAGLKISVIEPYKAAVQNLEITAPADDYSISLKLSNDAHIYNYGNYYGAYNLEQEALQISDPSFPVQAIIEVLTKSIKYQSTINGYNKTLSYLSFSCLKHDEYGKALTIIGHVIKNNPDKESLDLVKFQKIIALLELGQLKTALSEIVNYDNNNILPAAYKEYLIRSCLRQVEREDALDAAINNPANKSYSDRFVELKSIIQDDFKAKTIITLFASEKDLINKLSAAQGMYDEAKRHYLNENYSDAKPPLLELLKTCHDQYVNAQETEFKAGPAVLDMLGNIHLKEKDAASAMDCFKTMVTVYPDDVYVGPEEGAFVYGGPAGAEGLLFQIEILSNNRYFTEIDNLHTDYEQAIKLSHQLMSKYDGKSPVYYSSGPKYEELAASSITECLKQIDASLERRKKEVFQILKETKNDKLSVNLLLTLGNICKQQKDNSSAIDIYLKVINKYGHSYYINLGDDHGFIVPSFEAFKQLSELLKQENRLSDIKKTQISIDNIYQDLKKGFVEENDDTAIENLAQKYRDCLNVK